MEIPVPKLVALATLALAAAPLPRGAAARTEPALPEPRDAAIELGVRWLLRHQDEQGSWSPDKFAKCCFGGSRCDGPGYPEEIVGETGLAILALLEAGYDERSTKEWSDPGPRKMLRAGDAVTRGLAWLRKRQDSKGYFPPEPTGEWGYSHAIATLAMTTAYELAHSPLCGASAQRAVDALVQSQSKGSKPGELLGWRYFPTGNESDISVTGWCTRALCAADRNGLWVPPAAIAGALTFCVEVTDAATGKVGYTKREEAGQQVKAPGKNDTYANHPGLAAVGMCVRSYASNASADATLDASAKLLLADLPRWDKAKQTNDYYYWHYGTVALRLFDGPAMRKTRKTSDYWQPWSVGLRKLLVEHQTRKANGCIDGSWDADDRWGFEGGRVYATAMNVLTLDLLDPK